MQVLVWPIAAFLVLLVAVILWSYGGARPLGDAARSRTWLGCSVVGTFAALIFSMFLVGVSAMGDAPRDTGDNTGRVFAVGFAPLVIALLVVAITARGRAGAMPGRRRLLTLLLITAFAIALIAVSYAILNS